MDTLNKVLSEYTDTAGVHHLIISTGDKTGDVKEIFMTEYEQALHDLDVALRFSEWMGNKVYLYEINGTAKVIADAVCALVEKRRNNS